MHKAPSEHSCTLSVPFRFGKRLTRVPVSLAVCTPTDGRKNWRCGARQEGLEEGLELRAMCSPAPPSPQPTPATQKNTLLIGDGSLLNPGVFAGTKGGTSKAWICPH